jgi:class 3 adenylate cyclase/alpha-beta hydrolase superfamily lysophospholipase
VNVPKTRYAVTDDGAHIAYQVMGEGPVDIVFVHAFLSHVELFWELPSFARMMQDLSAFGRVLTFDKRGVGLSDRLSQIPTLEARMDDLRAVMDAVGSSRVLLFGDGDGGALCALFAATYPERTLGLVLWGGAGRIAFAPDYPWGMSPERFEGRLARRMELWGDEETGVEATAMTFTVNGDALSRDPRFVAWLTKMQRYGAAPGDLEVFSRVWFETDVRSALPAIQVPTAVLYPRGWPPGAVEEASWTAQQIPGAELVALSGDADDPYLGDTAEVARAVDRLAASARQEEEAFDRVLATVLFTDIVGSTQTAADLGDGAWHALLERHHAIIRAMLGRFRGTEIDTAGDGFFATFDGPARGVRCAQAIAQAMRPLGLEVRAGLHTGEVETIDGKVGGIAVHIGARVASFAGPSEVLVSSTVKDLVAGSGLVFEDRGEHELKGVPGRWHVYAVLGGD